MPADERAVLAAARRFRAACRDPRLIRVAFEDGMLEWRPRGHRVTQGSLTVFADMPAAAEEIAE